MTSGVVSLLDVLRFAAEDFWKASQIMAEWRTQLPISLSPAYARLAGDTLRSLVVHLSNLELPISVREFQKLEDIMNHAIEDIKAISGVEQEAAFRDLNLKLSVRLEQVASVVHSELETRQFLAVPFERYKFYENGGLFALKVVQKFPGLQYDMAEAGNCYALGRGTACVFHLMRIMEKGVQSFGTKLGIYFTETKNWHNILDEVNKAIKALPPRDQAAVELSQVSANLYAVKVAWRNEVMHPKETYTLEEANTLFSQVQVFMVNLAGVL